MLLVIVKLKKLLKCFRKKELRKTNQKEFRVEKEIKRKQDKLYSNGMATIIILTVGLIKKDVV